MMKFLSPSALPRRAGTVASAAVLAASALFTVQAQAVELSYTTYLAPTEVLAAYNFTPFAEAVKKRTNGDVDIKLYYAGALLPAREGFAGVRDGMADIAHISYTYTPKDLPLWAQVGDTGFEYPDMYVAAFAHTEYGLLNPAGNAEFLDKGIVFVSGTSTPTYQFICREKDWATPEQLAGKRVRTPGGGWSRFAASLKMVDVNIASSEMYTAFERGAIDCAAADVTHLITGANLMRVVKSVNMVEMGPYSATSGALFNAKAWKALSPENRKIIFEESANSLVRGTIAYDKVVQKALEEAKAAGVQVLEPSPELKAAYDTFKNGVQAEIVAAGNKAGVADMDQKAQAYAALMQKWTKLLEGVDRHDQEALSNLVWTEIYAKLDPNTYGIK